MKNIYFIVISILFIIYVIIEIRKKHLSIKESFWWTIGALIMLILSIFPRIIDHISSFLGIAYPPSLLFVISILFLVFIIFKNGKRLSKQEEKITELAQVVSILKEKVGSENEKK